MARIQYTVTFPAAKAGDEVTWPNTVKIYPDSNSTRPLGNGYIETAGGSFTGWSDATSVTFTRGGTDSVTVTSSSPTGTGAAIPTATFRAVTSLGASNGTDDTGALNALLAGGGLLAGVPGQTYLTTAPLVIPSNTVLDLAGCTVKLKTGSNCNIINNAAVANARTVSDVSTTASSTTVTSATASFVAGDVGKAVSIYAAGQQGVRLDTTIASVTNGTTAVLTTAPSFTLTNAGMSIGPRDSNIRIKGGKWIRDTGNGNAPGTRAQHSLVFRRIDGFTLDSDWYFQNSEGKYGVNISDVTDFKIADGRTNCTSDGVHVDGLCFNGKVQRIVGTVGDDMVALTTSEWTQYDDGSDGNISDVLVEDCYITGLNSQASTPHCVAVQGDDPNDPGQPSETKGFSVNRITVRRCADQATTTQRSVYILGVANDVTAERCSGNVTIHSYTSSVVMTGIRVSKHRFVYQTGGSTAAVNVDTVTVRDLTVDGITIKGDAATTLNGVVIGAAATVGTASCRNIVHLLNKGQLVYVFGAGTTVTDLMIADSRRDGVDYGTGRIFTCDTSGVTTHLRLTNINGTGLQYGWAVAGACNVYATGVTLDSINDFLANTGLTILRGAGNAWTGSGPTLSGGGTLRVQDTQYPVDLSKLNAVVGDMASNTSNANTGTLGVGPAVCIATTAPKWKSLVSGNTW